MTSSMSLPFINSSLTLLVCMTRVSSEPGLKEIKLISAVNWIFHSSLFLKSFINYLKYGSIKARYSSTINNLSPLLLYSIYLLL